MKIGIIGLANSGKTTVFNALTGGSAETAAFSSGAMEPNLGSVKVPDARLNTLAEMYKPKKTTFADVQYIDVAGLSGGASKNGGLAPAFLTTSRRLTRCCTSSAPSTTPACRTPRRASTPCATSAPWTWSWSSPTWRSLRSGWCG